MKTFKRFCNIQEAKDYTWIATVSGYPGEVPTNKSLSSNLVAISQGNWNSISTAKGAKGFRHRLRKITGVDIEAGVKDSAQADQMARAMATQSTYAFNGLNYYIATAPSKKEVVKALMSYKKKNPPTHPITGKLIDFDKDFGGDSDPGWDGT